MSRRDGWYGPSKPIAVEGGVKARSKRGAIGEQWWSARFIAVLESYGMSGRLQRGRNYARRGQVLEFDLSMGKVTARVQGSQPQPYKVTIGVLPLTTAQWKTVESRLASQALFRAKLLAGEMPAEIEQVFADCGTPLFPRSAADLDMRCSCPDWEVPCKHLAAVCYVLAEAFDDDPFAMLAWRGRSRDTLLGTLRRAGPRSTAGSPGTGGRGRAEVGAPATAMDVADASATSATRAVLADVTGPSLAQAGDFWSPGLSQARLRALAAPGVATVIPDLLLRMFDPPPLTVRGKDLRTVLSAAYEQLGRHADSGLSAAAMPVKVLMLAEFRHIQNLGLRCTSRALMYVTGKQRFGPAPTTDREPPPCRFFDNAKYLRLIQDADIPRGELRSQHSRISPELDRIARQRRRLTVPPASPGSVPVLAAARTGHSGPAAPGKRDNPSKMFSPAGEASARNCRKSPR
jgi:uncharacterized Zn finger protein